MQAAGGRSNQTLLWVLLGVGGLCALCGVGTMALVGLGVVAGATDSPVSSGPSPEARPGVEGGFRITFPPTFKPVDEHRHRFELEEGGSRHTVDVITLASIPGLDDPQGKLKATWTGTIVRDWPGAPSTTLPLRRFVQNGARAFYTFATVEVPGQRRRSMVSLYLVEAQDRFECFAVVQEFFDTGIGADFMNKYSFDTTHPAVETLLQGVEGSPVGLPLVSDDEVAGRWTYSTGAIGQYVHVITGSTSTETVSYAIRYQFDGDHRYTYRFQGATTGSGGGRFSVSHDEGTWAVEHDVLVLDGAQFDSKSFIIGAGVGLGGGRVLYVLPEGKWSLTPGAIAQFGELYETPAD
jgi:hypothetical protein